MAALLGLGLGLGFDFTLVSLLDYRGMDRYIDR